MVLYVTSGRAQKNLPARYREVMLQFGFALKNYLL